MNLFASYINDHHITAWSTNILRSKASRWRWQRKNDKMVIMPGKRLWSIIEFEACVTNRNWLIYYLISRGYVKADPTCKRNNTSLRQVHLKSSCINMYRGYTIHNAWWMIHMQLLFIGLEDESISLYTLLALVNLAGNSSRLHTTQQ